MKASNRENRPTVIVIKLGILAGLVIAAVTVAYLAKNTIGRSKTADVLGADVKSGVVDSTGQAIDSAKKAATDTVDWVNKTTSDVLSQSTQSVTDYVFNNTVGNLLKQFDKLPQQQQETIRQAICR
ncbi:hypothetical protein M1523_00235 [Patescibacteria group bacterium]|nr:hypothetical protein [Patescibacteria group bacterium]MCL5091935.1 hypothetical protein [Patescibacteria group bacterium]